MPRRILVVEDEFLVALDIENMLSALGWDVLGPAATIDDALALVEAERMDGALLDINVGGREVFPLADRLREERIPFVFATGYDAATILPERFADRLLLRKPYDEKRLEDIIDRVFASDVN